MPEVALIAAFPPPVSGQSLAARILRRGLRDAGIRVFELDLSDPISGTGILRRLFTLIALETRLAILCIRHRDAIVYIQLGHGKAAILRDLFLLATAECTGHPCIGHVHGSGFRRALDSLPAPVQWVARHLFGRLRAAVVLSDSLRDMFAGILPDDKIHAVDNGISREFVNNISTVRPIDGEFRILFLSNFLRAKGVETVLQTAQIAESQGLPWRFILAGAPDFDARRYVADHGLRRVTIHDVVTGNAKNRLYADADAFVLPSEYEGQPLCILEAMFAGLPVVTTRVGGIPEIFGDGLGVRYVEPRDPDALFAALRELWQAPDTRRTMGNANRQLAQTRFTEKKHIDRMRTILLDCV